MTAQSEIGPSAPSRLAVYAQAAEVHALARLAVELVTPGPSVDVGRALRLLDKIRVELGEGLGG